MSEGTLFQDGASEAPHPWGAWATLAWGLGAGVVIVASQTGLLFLALRLWHFAFSVPADLANLETNGPLLAFVTIVSTPILILYLAFIVRLRRMRFADYMALKIPRRHDLLIGIPLIIGVLLLASVAGDLAGKETPPFVTDSFASARAAGILPLFAFAIVVMAPLGEELLFRGFLYRGFADRLGVVPAVIITSASWALLHIQYDWFFVGEIFALGFALGLMRARSGSTVLTMLLHAAINASAFVQSGF